VDVNRLSQGQMVAAVSAILLFIFTFLPWFGVSGGIISGGGVVTASKNFSLWEIENPLDIFLLIVILVALLPAVMTLVGGGAEGGGLAGMATALLGGIGTLMIFYQLFDHDFFGVGFSTKIGFWLGFLACAGIAVGGYLSMQDDAGGERY
jgi:hypothetical protein